MRRRARSGDSAQAVLETALLIPIMLLLACNFIALMVQASVQEQLDSATALAAQSRFQAPTNSLDAAGAECCPDPRCCQSRSDATSLRTGGLPVGCRYAAESFYGTMRNAAFLEWHKGPLCLSGGDSGAGSEPARAAQPYPNSPLGSEVSCVVASRGGDGTLHHGFLDRTLNPPFGLEVVVCDASARLDFSRTPLAWGVFWAPMLHAHAEALPPPFRQ
ncbi:MAG: hypothetical protein E6J45_04045 [Chloroflexi bacterium]|nr:MAG: hypothetical protein E6J45_04045 [Chloroflexota bacterium]